MQLNLHTFTVLILKRRFRFANRCKGGKKRVNVLISIIHHPSPNLHRMGDGVKVV